MDILHTTFVGMDVSTGRQPFCYVALDNDLRLLALGQGDLQDAVAFTVGRANALIATGAPSGTSQGLLARPEVRRRFESLPPQGRRSDLRVAEHELHLRQIAIPRTPAKVEDCPSWMRQGFELYRLLGEAGYKPYPSEDANRLWLESQADAAYFALLGLAPFEARTLEGRLQRQLVLHELRLPVKDPLLFFEEVTRYKLLQSILPIKDIFAPAELNALALAYTAWLAAAHPEETICFGDESEGVIIIPKGNLPEIAQPSLL